MVSALDRWLAAPWRLMVLTAALLCFIAVVAFGYVRSASTFHASEAYQHSLVDCQDRVFARLPAEARSKADVQTFDHVSLYCYAELRRSDELGESTIRRGQYIHQNYENNVILFMVVLITLSGVALAGIQLLTSYNLAATGHLQGDGATDLSLEQGKLSIKSSVTGLIVLAISLAFFVIYVTEVYRIVPSSAAKDVPSSLPASSAPATPADPNLLDSGGLAPPPSPPAKAAK